MERFQSNMRQLFGIIVGASLLALLAALWFAILIYREAQHQVRNPVQRETQWLLDVQVSEQASVVGEHDVAGQRGKECRYGSFHRGRCDRHGSGRGGDGADLPGIPEPTQQRSHATRAGSVPLFLAGTVLYLASATSLGILLATIARSMPQFGLLFILVVLPMMILSGGYTPLESMPAGLQRFMEVFPSTHFTRFAQAILYRGAGFDVVWPDFVAVAGIGLAFFGLALLRFRKTVTLAQ